MDAARLDQARRDDATPSTGDLARMLGWPAACWRVHWLQLAAELRAAVVAEHPAAGRPGRGRAAHGSTRSALDEACRTAARWVDGGKPWGAGDLARACGLSRPTIVGYLAVWARAGRLERVDDQGRPVPRGTPTAPGEAALWRADWTMTPARVEAMPAGWRPRLELALRCLRLGASDEFVFGCLRRSKGNGDRPLTEWLRVAVRRQRREARRTARAVEAAARRADSGRECGAGEGLAGLAQRLAEFRGRNLTPPGTEHRPPPHNGPLGAGGAGGLAPRSAREARGGKPSRRDEPSVGQLRQVVEAGQARDGTEARRQWLDVLRTAEAGGEGDPVAVWCQLARIAATGQVRHRGRPVRVADPGELRLDDLVGRYEREIAEARVDLVTFGAVGTGGPVANVAALACYRLRRRLVKGDHEADDLSQDTPDDVDDLVDAPEPPSRDSHSASSGQWAAVCVPELEPTGPRLSPAELRAIRERVAAEHEAARSPENGRVDPGGKDPVKAPPGRLAAMLERARSERRGRPG